MKGLGVGDLGKKDKDGTGVGWSTMGTGEAWLCAVWAGNGDGWWIGVGDGGGGGGGGLSLGVGEAGW